MRMRHLLRLTRSESGHTLVELLAVMIIMGIVLTALTTLFVSGAKAELETNKRFQAQSQARIAVDRLRREIHCASAISVGGGGASVVVTLPAHCPTSGGVIAQITYDTVFVSANRYRLRRARRDRGGLPLHELIALLLHRTLDQRQGPAPRRHERQRQPERGMEAVAPRDRHRSEEHASFLTMRLSNLIRLLRRQDGIALVMAIGILGVLTIYGDDARLLLELERAERPVLQGERLGIRPGRGRDQRDDGHPEQSRVQRAEPVPAAVDDTHLRRGHRGVDAGLSLSR